MELKDQLFSEFLIVWKDQYEKVKNILRYLETYSALLGQIKDFKLIHVKDLDQSQREWIRLLSHLDNPIETSFMKPYWVPINADEYDQFIDLSSPIFELFELDYFCFEPYQWLRYPLIQDITQFMFATDDDDLQYVAMEKLNAEKIKSLIISGLFKNRVKLGLQGKIGLKRKEFSRNTLIPGNRKKEPQIERKGETLLITGVTAEAISILPGHLNIILDEISYADEPGFNTTSIINNIEAFAFLLRQSKHRQVNSYFVIFDDCPFDYVWFENDTLFITHSDKQIMDAAQKNLQRILSGK